MTNTKSKDGSVTIPKGLRLAFFTQCNELMAMIAKMSANLSHVGEINTKTEDIIRKNTLDFMVTVCVMLDMDGDEMVESVKDCSAVSSAEKEVLSQMMKPPTSN
jgi:hypothetical protein|tara:strand:- start:631 stop:942 length:312 start_codon:yes stop_codon:yes gene_type:complete